MIALFAIGGVALGFIPQAYSETLDAKTTEQITLHGDLLNDPLALEILQKIEESKKKIEKLQQQNYDNLQAQKFLEERRAVALERLNQALIVWEEKWHEFSPKVAYQKFIDKMPSDVQGIYAKQFEFTEAKHELGVAAKDNALDKGMSSSQALTKFNNAAKSTVKELIDYNETIQPDSPSEISTKITIVEGAVDSENARYSYRHAILNGDLNAKYAIEVENERKEIRYTLNEYNSGSISQKELGDYLKNIREKYATIKENVLNENSRILLEFESNHMDYVQRTIKKINNDDSISSIIEAVWNPDTASIEIIRK